MEKAKQEAERQRIDAEGKATANRILSASLTAEFLQEKGIEATTKLSESPNAKVIIIGSGKDGYNHFRKSIILKKNIIFANNEKNTSSS